MEILNNILLFVLDHWAFFAPLIYEIIARAWPTKYNISILDNLWKMVDYAVKNRRIEQPTDNKVTPTTNVVEVDVNKHILK